MLRRYAKKKSRYPCQDPALSVFGDFASGLLGNSCNNSGVGSYGVAADGVNDGLGLNSNNCLYAINSCGLSLSSVLVSASEERCAEYNSEHQN